MKMSRCASAWPDEGKTGAACSWSGQWEAGSAPWVGWGGQSQDMTVVCELGHLNGGQVVEDLKYHGESLN